MVRSPDDRHAKLRHDRGRQARGLAVGRRKCGRGHQRDGANRLLLALWTRLEKEHAIMMMFSSLSIMLLVSTALDPVADFGSNPGNLTMFEHMPDASFKD